MKMSARTKKHLASTLTSGAPLDVSWDNEYFEHVTKTGRATEKIKIHLSIRKKKEEEKEERHRFPKTRRITTCKDPGCVQGHGMTI